MCGQDGAWLAVATTRCQGEAAGLRFSPFPGVADRLPLPHPAFRTGFPRVILGLQNLCGARHWGKERRPPHKPPGRHLSGVTPTPTVRFPKDLLKLQRPANDGRMIFHCMGLGQLDLHVQEHELQPAFHIMRDIQNDPRHKCEIPTSINF